MVQVFAFHLMPYFNLPEDFKEQYGTSWINLPNSYFDPDVGQSNYNDYFAQLELADRLGYDGIVVNEHHQTAYGTMPSPNVIAALLARHLKQAKIAILGNAISLHEIPQKVAEEVAILDVVTGGRIISGFVRGIGAEYFSYRNINPFDSKARFYEAHDLIKRAWTEPGPFEFHGKYYHFPYVNVWPRPKSKPHPPIWCPSQGSLETIKFAAKHRYTYLQTLSPVDSMVKAFNAFREEANKLGYEADDSQLGWSHSVYVAETDAKAWEEAEEHFMYFHDKLLDMPAEMHFPPGYLPEKAHQQLLKDDNFRPIQTFKQYVEDGLITVGSPETVRQRLTELHAKMGFGNIVAHLHKGNMPHWKAMKNIELFGKEVLPHIQKLGKKKSEEEKVSQR